MLELIRNVVVALLAFLIGLTFQSFEVPKRTLEEISKDISGFDVQDVSRFDGQMVEVESYVNVGSTETREALVWHPGE